MHLPAQRVVLVYPDDIGVELSGLEHLAYYIADVPGPLFAIHGLAAIFERRLPSSG